MGDEEKTVLTLENDQGVRKLLVDIIIHAGYRPLEASTSREALETIQQERIDLILLDLNLPGVHGHQFLKYIRDRGNTTPVIVISGYLTKEVLQEIMAAGVNAVITKPVDVNRLMTTMQKAIGKKGNGT